MTTTWIPAAGFETHYEVSDEGQVRRTAVKFATPGKILAPVMRNGYACVNLSVNGTRYQRKIHRLVAESFGSGGVGPIVRHLDDDRTNNRLDNLMWGTNLENTADAIRNGKFVPKGYPVRPFCKNGHLFTPETSRPRRDSGRLCRTCVNERAAKYREMRRAKRDADA